MTSSGLTMIIGDGARVVGEGAFGAASREPQRSAFQREDMEATAGAASTTSPAAYRDSVSFSKLVIFPGKFKMNCVIHP